MYLPSPKKYKIQLVSQSKLRKRPVAAQEVNVKPIFDQKYIKIFKNNFTKPKNEFKSL